MGNNLEFRQECEEDYGLALLCTSSHQRTIDKTQNKAQDTQHDTQQTKHLADRSNPNRHGDYDAWPAGRDTAEVSGGAWGVQFTKEHTMKITINCDQCELLTINGVLCHENGCPNTHSRFDVDSGEWVKQRECFECGCTVNADDPCCEPDSDN